MQPADTALTRMYNQPTEKLHNGKVVGLLYKNPIDCLWKTFKTEGALGWYKGVLKPFSLIAKCHCRRFTPTEPFFLTGTTAHFLRIAPHTIITLTANDIIINTYRSFW